jgi:hypothetical protein
MRCLVPCSILLLIGAASATLVMEPSDGKATGVAEPFSYICKTATPRTTTVTRRGPTARSRPTSPLSPTRLQGTRRRRASRRGRLETPRTRHTGSCTAAGTSSATGAFVPRVGAQPCAVRHLCRIPRCGGVLRSVPVPVLRPRLPL